MAIWACSEKREESMGALEHGRWRWKRREKREESKELESCESSVFPSSSWQQRAQSNQKFLALSLSSFEFPATSNLSRT
jgi:hypothetical protein